MKALYRDASGVSSSGKSRPEGSWCLIPRLMVSAVVLSGVVFSQSSPQRVPYKQMRYVMGTLCEVSIYDSDTMRAQQASNRAFEEMQRVDRLLSNYDPASELSRMNRLASSVVFEASPELFKFVKECHRFFGITEGAFDPTVGPIVRAWGFLGAHPHIPSEDETKLLRRKIGMEKVEINDADATIYFPVQGMEIDPGGIGKGYAVDRAARALKEFGVTSALINAGSSTFYALGHPPDQEFWWIGVKDPQRPEQAIAFVPLCDNSLSTSGILERQVQAGERTFGHIFDPRSGRPVEGILEVSVIAPTATESDALTKAAFVLTQRAGFKIFQALSGVHVLRVEVKRPHGWQVATTPWSTGIFRIVRGVGSPALSRTGRKVELRGEN
jgi:thiamine biosynthesis lipoprotein